MKSKIKQLSESTLNWIICYLEDHKYIDSNNILSKGKNEKINSISSTIINNGIENELFDIICDASDNSINESIKKKVPENIVGLIYFYRWIEKEYKESHLELIINNDRESYSSVIKILEIENYKDPIKEYFINEITNYWNDDKKHILKLKFLNNANDELKNHIENYMKDNTDYYNELKNIGLIVSDNLSIESIKAYWLYNSNSWKNDSVLYKIEKLKRSVSNKRYRMEKKEQKKKPVSYMFSEDAINALNKLTEGSTLEKGAYLERLILREYAKMKAQY